MKEGEDGREDQGKGKERVANVVDREGQDRATTRDEPEGVAQGVDGATIVPDADMEEVHDGKRKRGGEDQGEVQEEPGAALGGKTPGEGGTGMGDLPAQEGFPPLGAANTGGDEGVRAGEGAHETRAAERAYPKARTRQPVFTRKLTTFVEL